MTGVRVNGPYRETGTPPGIPMRPSRFLLGALIGFAVLTDAAVVQAVFALAGPFHATVAALACLAVLALAGVRWARRQPAAIALHADGVTLWTRAGEAQYWRIVGCAQWSARLVALTLSSGKRRPRRLLVAADSLDSDSFRQLAVRARRAASAYL
ncbi:protein YgfX [Caballeronia sp. LZ062]|uniref:protein YgfX n=1 Tax=unclassified Caballeronia TaxID=2646786 RepID=UPI002866D1D7|nr:MULTISPECIES: protein YgfX [unclassified Caballeronia]MDR5855010.1 protein YgfX [Caballeronia sp. LZ050]MDR5870461.1 protein YgfX [Caballeronia sp. LZ062]